MLYIVKSTLSPSLHPKKSGNNISFFLSVLGKNLPIVVTKISTESLFSVVFHNY